MSLAKSLSAIAYITVALALTGCSSKPKFLICDGSSIFGEEQINVSNVVLELEPHPSGVNFVRDLIGTASEAGVGNLRHDASMHHFEITSISNNFMFFAPPAGFPAHDVADGVFDRITREATLHVKGGKYDLSCRPRS